MDAAQIVLDVTAIGVCLYTLISLFKAKQDWLTDMSYHLKLIDGLTRDTLDVKEDLKQVISFQKEMIQSGVEPGIYLPKKEQENGEIEYAKAMDLSDWKEIVGMKGQ